MNLDAVNILNVFVFQRDEKNAFESLGTGNRIATVLFYVSHKNKTHSILIRVHKFKIN